MVKKISGKVVEKNLQQYYTKSNSIVSYMVKQLKLNQKDIVLEPCAGDGVFIDEILKLNINLDISLIELDEKANIILEKKYHNNDSIKLFKNNFFYNENYIDSTFDKIIGNPPYGAWIDYEERSILKRKFPDISTKDTYALFMYESIKLLNNNGRLVFIVPETFLYLHRHTRLREFILKNTAIEEIAIFPSSFFPDVNFGYSKLCIITLEKKSVLNLEVHNFSLLEDLNSPDDLLKSKKKKFLNQKEVLNNKDYTFYFTHNDELKEFINNPDNTLGDLAACVTGIYTGNNKKYFHVLSHDLKNSKSNTIIEKNKVHTGQCDITGIRGDKHFIPVARGAGQSQFFKEDKWFIDWGEDAIQHYVNDKKARFQNSRFYFKTGIAIPMVKTKRSTAFLLQNKVFEQSVVGVFPYEEKYLYYFLALFNSEIASKIIAIINPTANNSANYLKKFPIILPSETILKEINLVVSNILTNSIFAEDEQKEINMIFEKLYERINI